MPKPKGKTVRTTLAEQLARPRIPGQIAVRRPSDQEIEHAASTDADARLATADELEAARVRDAGGGKVAVSLRIDREILDAFRATGKGWQTRINDVLAASVPTADGDPLERMERELQRAIHAYRLSKRP